MGEIVKATIRGRSGQILYDQIEARLSVETSHEGIKEWHIAMDLGPDAARLFTSDEPDFLIELGDGRKGVVILGRDHWSSLPLTGSIEFVGTGPLESGT